MKENNHIEQSELDAKVRNDQYPYISSDDPEFEKVRQKQIREHRAARHLPPLKMPLIGEREPGDEE